MNNNLAQKNTWRTPIYCLLIISCMILSSAAFSQEVLSLRGQHSIDAASVPTEITRYQTEVPPMRRGYVQQPPLIPHSIKGYKINLRSNKCLTCHSWANAKTMGATKISLTHFKDRDGIELADVSPRRYFCVQCHVPQKNVRPLIRNTFTSVKALR
jgi:nitrate reductase (cytochrome), electron transfer subunit